MKVLKSLICKHDYQFNCNIIGDAINYINLKKVYRSIWKCSKCDKYKLEKYLHCEEGLDEK